MGDLPQFLPYGYAGPTPAAFRRKPDISVCARKHAQGVTKISNELERSSERASERSSEKKRGLGKGDSKGEKGWVGRRAGGREWK